MTIRAVGSSTFSCATTIVTTPVPLGLYVAWKMPIDGVYDAAAIAVTASANAAAHPKTVKRMDLFMAPSFVVSPACSCSDANSTGQLYRETRLCVGSLVQSRDGRAGDRRLRLGYGWTHGSPRVPGDDAARGLRLPRRPRAPALRPAAVGRGARFCAGDRPLPGAAGRQARARRLQYGHLGRIAKAPGGALGSGRRCDPARGARGRTGDPQPHDRLAPDQGDRRGGAPPPGPFRSPRPGRGHGAAPPEARGARPGRRSLWRRDPRRRPPGLPDPEGRRGGHR